MDGALGTLLYSRNETKTYRWSNSAQMKKEINRSKRHKEKPKGATVYR